MNGRSVPPICSALHALCSSLASASATNGPASSIMIGEVAGTEDFATGTRISGQRNAADQMLQPGQWTAGNCLDLTVANRLPDALLSRLPGLGSNRGRHDGTLRKLPGQTSFCSSLRINRRRDGNHRDRSKLAALGICCRCDPMSVAELEKAFEALSLVEKEQFAEWYESKHAQGGFDASNDQAWA